MSTVESFKEKFRFDPQFALHVGVEREHFVCDSRYNIVAKCPEALQHIHQHGWRRRWGAFGREIRLDPGAMVSFELSAAQIETKTRPVQLEALKAELQWQDRELKASMRELGLRIRNIEVAPDDMPLDIYPDPSGRYAKIAASMTRERLLAACQVAGTHVHIGMPDHETVLRVYNAVVRKTRRLLRAGDGSQGRRIAIYKKVQPEPEPPRYEGWPGFYMYAQEHGFAEDPRSCWTWIRMSRHGTIEFRMFGATESIDRVVAWASLCHRLCRNAI